MTIRNKFTFVNFTLVNSDEWIESISMHATVSPLKNVSDLKFFMEDQKLSPEKLSEITHISNMTWRRLLQKNSRTTLPIKYQRVLESAFRAQSKTPGHALPSPEEIVISGLGGSEALAVREIRNQGKSCDSEKSLFEKVSEKLSALLESVPIVKKLKSQVSAILGALSSNARPKHRTLMLGGLIYFLNPFDLISDFIINIGLIDDIGALSLVLSRIKKD